MSDEQQSFEQQQRRGATWTRGRLDYMKGVADCGSVTQSLHRNLQRCHGDLRATTNALYATQVRREFDVIRAQESATFAARAASAEASLAHERLARVEACVREFADAGGDVRGVLKCLMLK